MTKREEELMRVIMNASIELIQTFNSGISEQVIRRRMVRIATDLVESAREI